MYCIAPLYYYVLLFCINLNDAATDYLTRFWKMSILYYYYYYYFLSLLLYAVLAFVSLAEGGRLSPGVPAPGL